MSDIPEDIQTFFHSPEEQRALLSILEDLQADKDALNKQQRSIEELLENLSDGVLVFGVDAKITMVNEAARIMCEAETDDQVTIVYLEAFFQKKALAKLFKEVLKTSEMISGQEWAHNGRIFDIAIVSVPNTKDRTIGGAVVMRDITEAKRIDQMKTDFVSVASHQLRTPLTAIKLFNEMLIEEQVGELNDKQKEYMEKVSQSTERMIRLVNDLLNVSRLETGRLTIVSKETKIEDFLKTIIDRVCEARAPLGPCPITLQAPQEELPEIKLDSVLMGQVFHNLFANALQYAHPEREIAIQVHLETHKENEQVPEGFIQVSVEDNGIGIPMEAQPRLFEKFFRADNAIKQVADGSGLGLYVVKMVVEECGGKIWFTSHPGKGTTFFVTIPFEGMQSKKGDRTLIEII